MSLCQQSRIRFTEFASHVLGFFFFKNVTLKASVYIKIIVRCSKHLVILDS
jgi:hypothetical protein